MELQGNDHSKTLTFHDQVSTGLAKLSGQETALCVSEVWTKIESAEESFAHIFDEEIGPRLAELLLAV